MNEMVLQMVKHGAHQRQNTLASMEAEMYKSDAQPIVGMCLKPFSLIFPFQILGWPILFVL
jgi:hypothetical protein